MKRFMSILMAVLVLMFLLVMPVYAADISSGGAFTTEGIIILILACLTVAAVFTPVGFVFAFLFFRNNPKIFADWLAALAKAQDEASALTQKIAGAASVAATAVKTEEAKI